MAATVEPNSTTTSPLRGSQKKIQIHRNLRRANSILPSSFSMAGELGTQRIDNNTIAKNEIESDRTFVQSV